MIIEEFGYFTNTEYSVELPSFQMNCDVLSNLFFKILRGQIIIKNLLQVWLVFSESVWWFRNCSIIIFILWLHYCEKVLKL